MTKTQLRKDISLHRKRIDQAEAIRWSTSIAQNLLALEDFQSAETIALYQAVTGEVQLDELFSFCWDMGKKTCIPIYNSKNAIYEMGEFSSDTDLKRGKYGINEPITPALVPLDQIDVIIIPGVAFDAQGNRLGRGGGYYDRLLAGYTGKRIGAAYDFQVIPEIPTDSHDEPVDFVITESRTIEV